MRVIRWQMMKLAIAHDLRLIVALYVSKLFSTGPFCGDSQ